MSRNVGMSILRMIAVIGGVAILFMCVLTAGATFMPGTKIGHFGGSAKALAGEDVDGARTSAPLAPVAATPATGSLDAGTGADAGSMAASPAGQGGSAPVEAQVLPEQQGR